MYMVTNISWTDYLMVMLLLLVIYYVLIGFRYYFNDLKKLAANLIPTAFGSKLENPESSNFDDTTKAFKQMTAEGPDAGTTEDTLLEVEHLIMKLKEIIENASIQNTAKNKFKENLKSILNQYPEIKNSPFQSAVNELIISECTKHDSIILSENEVVMLWNEV